LFIQKFSVLDYASFKIYSDFNIPTDKPFLIKINIVANFDLGLSLDI